MKNEEYWPHTPLHRLDAGGVFIVTAATLHKSHVFQGSQRLDLLQTTLLGMAKQYGCQLEAWAVFPNHYHFVGRTGVGNSFRSLLTHLHADTSREVNRLDGMPGRRVWFNFWETRLTFKRSYFARLNYVHQNAVRHRLVREANQYPWCSASWFERVASKSAVRTIYSFKIDNVSISDDY